MINRTFLLHAAQFRSLSTSDNILRYLLSTRLHFTKILELAAFLFFLISAWNLPYFQQSYMEFIYQYYIILAPNKLIFCIFRDKFLIFISLVSFSATRSCFEAMLTNVDNSLQQLVFRRVASCNVYNRQTWRRLPEQMILYMSTARRQDKPGRGNG